MSFVLNLFISPLFYSAFERIVYLSLAFPPLITLFSLSPFRRLFFNRHTSFTISSAYSGCERWWRQKWSDIDSLPAAPPMIGLIIHSDKSTARYPPHRYSGGGIAFVGTWRGHVILQRAT